MIYRPQNDDGQGLVEYALILVLVAVVVVIIPHRIWYYIW